MHPAFMILSTARRGGLIMLSLLLAACSAGTPAEPDADQPATRGIAPSVAAPQMQAAFLRLQQQASAARCAARWRELCSAPRVAGTDAAHAAALRVQQEFLRCGLTARVEEYEVLLPQPREVSLEMLAPFAWKATLAEPGADSADQPELLPLLAYSPDTEVTGRAVWLNRGLEADYAALAAAGVDVRKAIGIARLGGSYRGSKLKLAAQHGLAALVLFCDPQDDGFVRGDVWPRGPWRPMNSLQRGSVLDITQLMGDPLTPGRPALPGVERLRLEDAPAIPAIAGISITAQDAATLLGALEGPAVPKGFQGGLPFTYHLGGTDAVTLRLSARSDWSRRTIRNVIGEIPGTLDPGTRVMLCAHRDAWGSGGVDNAGGTTVLLECAEILGRLAQQGLKPARTLSLCSFDAEEYGLIGSGEHAEAHEAELEAGLALVLNLDACVSGPEISITTAHEAAHFVRSALQGTGLPCTLAAQGGGSDHAPFVQRFGTPSVSVSAHGPYGVYHSLLDNAAWVQRFGDPDGAHARRVASTTASIAWAAADSTVFAVDVVAHAQWVQSCVESAELSDQQRAELRSAVSALLDAARELAARIAATAASDPDPVRLVRANRWLATLPRQWLSTAAEHGRPGWRNLLLGVNPADGYGALALPELRRGPESGAAACAQLVSALRQTALAETRIAALLAEAAAR